MIKFIISLSLLCFSNALLAASVDENEASSHSLSEPKLSTLLLSKAIKAIKTYTPELQKKFNVPGVNVAIIDNANIVWSQGFGVLDARSNVKVNANSVMEVASLSKPFFAYLVLTWAEEGKIDLDKPLYKYLEQDYLPNDTKDELITARMVLTHSSGLPNWRRSNRGGASLSHQWENKIGGTLTFQAPMSFEAEPNSGFVYSGEGFLMLQRVIEKQSGLSLSQWANQRLIRSIGLNNTHFGWHATFTNNAARGHNRNGEVTDTSISRNSDINELVVNSAASLYSSANDYAQFLLEILKANRSAPHSLSAKGVKHMLTKTTISIPSERPAFMGLGWMLGLDEDNHFIAMHTGNNGDFRAMVVMWPEFKDGLIILTNAARGNELIGELLQTFESE